MWNIPVRGMNWQISFINNEWFKTAYNFLFQQRNRKRNNLKADERNNLQWNVFLTSIFRIFHRNVINLSLLKLFKSFRSVQRNSKINMEYHFLLDFLFANIDNANVRCESWKFYKDGRQVEICIWLKYLYVKWSLLACFRTRKVRKIERERDFNTGSFGYFTVKTTLNIHVSLHMWLVKLSLFLSLKI